MNKILEKQQVENNSCNINNNLQYTQNSQPNTYNDQYYAQNFNGQNYCGNVAQDVNFGNQNIGYVNGQQGVQNGYYAPQNNVYFDQNNSQFAVQNGNFSANYDRQNSGYATQNFSQPQAQNIPQNYQFGYTQNDQQQLYTQQNYRVANSQGYGVEYKAQVGKKPKTNIRAKLLIVTYFLIVTVIATLLLVNVFGINNAAAAGELPAQAPIEVSNVAYDANGNTLQLEELQPIINYEYETQTNWFDKMCDNITKLFG
ncbi:MAG: hypothetical protein RR348_01785 [Clostridia bacterium]